MTKFYAFWHFPLYSLVCFSLPFFISLVFIFLDIYVLIAVFFVCIPSFIIIICCLINLFKNKIIISDNSCSEYVFGKQVKKIENSSIKRIVIFDRQINIKGKYIVKTIALDDGTFSLNDMDLQKKNLIMMDYTKKRIKLLSENLNIPIESID